jgi:hypothetical protein
MFFFSLFFFLFHFRFHSFSIFLCLLSNFPSPLSLFSLLFSLIRGQDDYDAIKKLGRGKYSEVFEGLFSLVLTNKPLCALSYGVALFQVSM